MDKRVLSAEEKALLQAKHRMEEAQAREREKERKRRTRRLIQEGAILESVFPAAVDMDFVAAERLPCRTFARVMRLGNLRVPLSFSRSPANKNQVHFSEKLR